MIAQFQRQITELEQLRAPTESDTACRNKEQNKSRFGIKLIWKEGEKAPCKMRYNCCAAMDGSALYIRSLHLIYRFSISTSSWSRLPNSPTDVSPSVIINNLLTFVGSNKSFDLLRNDITNQLFSLTGEGSGKRWTNEFPPMPTKRYASTALCTGADLIVAGGQTENYSRLKTVEVMNTETRQWSTAVDLPIHLAYMLKQQSVVINFTS